MTRMHITREGDLEVFTLALDKIPTHWREDPAWSPPHTPHNTPPSRANALSRSSSGRAGGAHTATTHGRNTSSTIAYQQQSPYAHTMSRCPSRWRPAHGEANEGWYLVDYFKVAKQRVL